MKRIVATGAFLLLGTAGASVGALDNIHLLGSDTMFDLTKAVINACPGAAGLTYDGSGSGNGETAMKNGTQTVAPMSRFLQTASCSVTNGTAAEGIAVALDGVGVVTNTTSAANCGGVAFSSARSIPVTDRNSTAGVQCPGCDASNNYVVADYADALRLLFMGFHHDSAQTRDCDSDARRSLVADWKNLFQGDCGSSACAGKPIRHAWRRDDASGTTDTFISLLNVPSAYKPAAALPTDTTKQQSAPFCNAPAVVNPGTNFRVVYGYSDFLDNDPIRVKCDGRGNNAGEQVCSSDGTLGLVLPMLTPVGVPTTQLYATAFCTTGEVELLPSIRATYTGKCPNGADSFGGKCFASVIRNADGSFNANCIQVNTSAACPFLTPTGADCRGSNLWARNADGSLMQDSSLGTKRLVTGAFYRIHATKVESNAVAGTTGCQQPDATSLISCLAGAASPCSVGFAGRGAFEGTNANANADGLAVGGKVPSVANIQNLILAPADKYPLSRKLYVSSIKGFENVTGQELALAKCFSDDTLMQGAGKLVEEAGFVSLPVQAGRSFRALCEDYNEQTGCAQASNSAACGNNPAGLPTN